MKTRNQFPTREGYNHYRRDYYNKIAANFFGWVLGLAFLALVVYGLKNFIEIL